MAVWFGVDDVFRISFSYGDYGRYIGLMTLNTPNGLNSYFEDDAIPTINDMIDIMASVAEEDQFRAMCVASTSWPHDLTNAEFLEACQDWVDQN